MTPHLSRNDSLATLCDESTPLLYGHPHDEIEAQKSTRIPSSPLPKRQLAALCATRLVDPVAFTQVFPYINEFLASLHLTDNPSQIGFYSGVESSFAVTQLCSIYHWARLSDIVGRRPVIIGGAAGLAVSTLFFGVSTNFLEILISRCIAGIFSGTAAVLLSALGEITDSTNQAQAFPIFGLFWPLGSIIGPLIGGAFANPADHFSNIIGSEYLRKFPYFLPCFVSGLIALVAVIAAYAYLEETLPSKRQLNCESSNETISDSNTHLHPDTMIASESERILTMYELFSYPTIRDLSISGCALSFVATAFDVVFVLFCYTSISAGGLGFSASQIGYSLAVAGSISASIQLLFLPHLLRTFNNAKLYDFCNCLWLLAFACLPILNLIARNDTGLLPAATARALVWLGVALVLGVSRIGCLAYSISMVLVKENTPNLASLGATNGLVQFAMCSSRSISPAFVSSTFAWSLGYNLLGGHMWVIIMVGMSVVSCVFSRRVAQHASSGDKGFSQMIPT
ncbi:hypothetical protein AMATHDRAFT_146091 [Amanita thiersii Skay4041]|uniref:Major facilitator superfamily (MFS) profile domain-containing protein n=1 Tax=Amanita thiersii Skay4041 TaxID=703135 RepID=A0A2A9NP18_9AGAR|nr:hypothetical protein AMATHDRAFT_146091 [Amanita thiersii Skay4041]